MKKLSILTFLISAFIGCAVSENFGENADSNKTQQIEVTVSFEEAYRSAIQVASEKNWSIKNSDSEAGFFRAETPSSARAWSDEVNITIIEEGEITKIIVRSNLGQEPNRKIVSDFLNDLQNRIEN